MATISTLTARTISLGLVKFGVLFVLFFACFAYGGSLVAPALPANNPEPGPLPLMASLLIVTVSSALVVALIVLSSSWHGLKLMLTLALTYYVAVTFLMQIEAWYFLYGVTIGPDLMPLMFLQGIPVALVFVPLAVVILGRARRPAAETGPVPPPIEWRAWVWKLPVIVAAYVALYLAAGYFIAWQNPAVRAFYGESGPALSFLGQTAHILTNDPWLSPFQVLRALLWTACALPIIRGTRWPMWATAVVVGLMFSVPQNLGHLLPNDLLPINSVRLSHLVETASSTFVFGLIVTGLLYQGPALASEPGAQPGSLRHAQAST